MSTRHVSISFGIVVIAASVALPVGGQPLDSRLHSATSPRIQFEFAGKGDVCGDGHALTLLAFTPTRGWE